MSTPPPSAPERDAPSGRNWFPQLIILGFLGLTAALVTLAMPWHVSNYHLTQWVVYGEPTLALRALPSLLAGRLLETPVGVADLLPLFLATLFALNLLLAFALWLILRLTGPIMAVAVGLLALTGTWQLVNASLVPSTDPLMYLPAVVALVLCLLFGASRWLLPVLWLLAAVVLYVHPAGLFSAIPILFAAHVLLRPATAWSWRDLGGFALSIVVVLLLLAGGRSLDPPRPTDAEFPAVIAAKIADVETRAEFRVAPLAAVNQYRGLGDVLQQTVHGSTDFFGIRMARPRLHYAIPAALFLLAKIVLVLWLLPWRQLRAAFDSWHPWQRLIGAGAVLAPLPLFVLGLDYQRWFGFIDWNLTVVLLLLLVQARRSGQSVEPVATALPVVAGAFLFQLMVAAGASRFAIG